MALKPQSLTAVLLSMILLLAAAAIAQEGVKPANTAFSQETIADMGRLRDAALASGYAYEQVRYLTDNIGPRLTGSPQAAAAVEHVADEMRKLGLEVTLEPVIVPHWVRGEETAELVSYQGHVPGATQKIVLTALGHSTATPPQGLTADVIVVKSWDEFKALAPEQVKGKIVLFNEKFDKRMAAGGYGLAAYGDAVMYRALSPEVVAAKGGVAALIRSVGGADYRLPHTGVSAWRKPQTEVPAAALAAEDADLVADLAAQGPVRMHLTLTPKFLPEVKSYNVIGDLKGSEHPEQVVIASGHLDSWDLGTGAIDDAAGVGVAIEAAQLIHSLGLRPKRTIRVIAWMDEETSGAGNRQYAKDHEADMANQFAAIESDLGSDHPVGFYVTGKPELQSFVQPIADLLDASGASVVEAVDWTGSDITPLAKAGVPCFQPIQDSRFYFNYHHTAADTLDKVNPQTLRENAAIMVVLAYGLANSNQSLPR